MERRKSYTLEEYLADPSLSPEDDDRNPTYYIQFINYLRANQAAREADAARKAEGEPDDDNRFDFELPASDKNAWPKELWELMDSVMPEHAPKPPRERSLVFGFLAEDDPLPNEQPSTPSDTDDEEDADEFDED